MTAWERCTRNWVQKSAEGFTLSAQEMRLNERGAGFSWICLNSPYLHEMVWPQIRENLV